jgi:16S rRNA (guanine1207-N2)-methyltransferase
LLKVFTRPGVFSHRRLDAGTRALLEAVEVQPNQRILDLGCGAGPVATAFAAREKGITIEAVDANPRAIACTLRTCELNGISSVRTHLNSDAKCGERGTVDLAAGNPPYFSNFRIAELFLASALEALKPGGRAIFVTKQPSWFEENMKGRFTDFSTSPVRDYVVVRWKYSKNFGLPTNNGMETKHACAVLDDCNRLDAGRDLRSTRFRRSSTCQ